jgi:hypothetical protein
MNLPAAFTGENSSDALASESILVYNFPNVHARSYRIDFYAFGCRVNIQELAVSITVS